MNEVHIGMAAASVASERPFVVRDVREELGWRAFDQWVPSVHGESGDRLLPVVLADFVSTVACQSTSSPFFTYFKEDRPISDLQSVQSLKTGAPVVHQHVPACDFVSAMHGEQPPRNSDDSKLKNCTSVYFSKPLQGEKPELLSDVLPLDDFVVREHAIREFFPDQVDAVKLMLWMGSNGTVTRMHYDWSHNFHVLLYGRKRFRLYPPHDSWDLHLYPYLHPRATKSQLAFDGAGFSSDSLHPYDVVLAVGDVLYIPPLWHHEVTSLEPTVSLAVWSPSAETLFMNEVLTLGLPFTQAMMTSPQSRANALSVFLHMLLIGVERFGQPSVNLAFGDIQLSVPKQSPGGYIKSLFESRFVPLHEAVPELFPESAPFNCPSLAWVTKSEESFALEQHFLDHVRDVFVPRFAFIPKHRRDVWMADFIEITANFVLGLQSVAPFLECLASWR